MTIRNLEYALRPSSIAVIGASDDGGSVGEKLTENVLGGGFAGRSISSIQNAGGSPDKTASRASTSCLRRRTSRSSPRRQTPFRA